MGAQQTRLDHRPQVARSDLLRDRLTAPPEYGPVSQPPRARSAGATPPCPHLAELLDVAEREGIVW